MSFFFFFNDTATTEIYTLSLHDALPIWPVELRAQLRPVALHLAGPRPADVPAGLRGQDLPRPRQGVGPAAQRRSEEHTSELQSRQYLVCRLLLEKKKKHKNKIKT